MKPEPVSYTHLDGYKRQILYSSVCAGAYNYLIYVDFFTKALYGIVNKAVHLPVAVTAANIIQKIVKNFKDVYKRQKPKYTRVCRVTFLLILLANFIVNF